METERIELSARERERLKVLQQVEEGHIKQVEAARRLRVSDRQVRRWQQRLRKKGDGGIVHRLRGRPAASRPCGSRFQTKNSQRNQIPSAFQSPLAQALEADISKLQ